jgi:hypothetical protein
MVEMAGSRVQEMKEAPEPVSFFGVKSPVGVHSGLGRSCYVR